MNEALQKLIETLSTLAPEVWKIMVRQAVMSGVMQIAWGIPVLIFTIWLSFYCQKNLKRWWTGNNALVAFGSVFFCFAGVIFSMTLLTGGIQYLINPGYYAIKDLLYIISQGG